MTGRRTTFRLLAICVIGAALVLTPQTASARGFHGGGFRGGWGGFRGGWGRAWGPRFYGGPFRGAGFYRGGFGPRFYAGFGPRFYGGFYGYPGFWGGLGLGLGAGFGPGFYGGGFASPVYYAGTGFNGCSCSPASYGLSNYSVVTTTPVATTPAVSNVMSRTTPTPVTTTASSVNNDQFQYLLNNNPYSRLGRRSAQSISYPPRPGLIQTVNHERRVEPPPAPGL